MIVGGDNKMFTVVSPVMEVEDLPMCKLCNPQQAIGKPGMDKTKIERHLRNHTASHIVQQKGWSGAMPCEPCGWCGGFICSVKIVDRSTCVVSCKMHPELPDFKLSLASKKTKSYPSTNHPLKCPGCKTYIWSYNIDQHLCTTTCGGKVTVGHKKISPHLPFTDEVDETVPKLQTERAMLKKLYTILCAE
jgi:hypothetical protein